MHSKHPVEARHHHQHHCHHHHHHQGHRHCRPKAPDLILEKSNSPAAAFPALRHAHSGCQLLTASSSFPPGRHPLLSSFTGKFRRCCFQNAPDRVCRHRAHREPRKTQYPCVWEGPGKRKASCLLSSSQKADPWSKGDSQPSLPNPVPQAPTPNLGGKDCLCSAHSRPRCDLLPQTLPSPHPGSRHPVLRPWMTAHRYNPSPQKVKVITTSP